MLFTIGIAGMYGQCNSYDYQLSKTGFSCDLSTGEFCFVANGNWTEPESECSQYVVDIKYPTGSITITNIGDYEFLSEDDDYTTIRGTVNLTGDATDFVCFEGLVNVPMTELRLFIVNPETGDVMNPEGDSFYLDDEETIGTDGVDTYLSDIIPFESNTIVVHGNLVVDIDYSFNDYATLQMSSGSGIRIQDGNVLKIIDTKIYACSNDTWNGIDVESGGKIEFIKSEISDASTAINLHNLSECYVFGGNFHDNTVGIALLEQSFNNDVGLHFEGSPWGGYTQFKEGDVGIWIRDDNSSLNINGFMGFSNLTTGIKTINTSSNLNNISFDNCTNGIVSQLSSPEWTFSSSIKNCEFTSNDNSIIVAGAFLSHIEDNNINGGSIAIKRVSQILDEVTYIKNNVISGVSRGVIGDLKQSVGYIQGNSISSYFTAVELNGVEGENKWYTQHNDLLETTASLFPGLTCVYYNNMQGATVYKNSDISSAFAGISIDGGFFNQIGYNDMDISGYNGIPVVFDSYGVRLNSSDISSVYCNSTSGNGAGINVLGDNSGGELRENEVSNTAKGIEYGNQIQTFGHTGIQAYKGNHFGVTTPGDPRAYNYNSSEIAIDDKFIVGSLAGSQGTDLFPYYFANISNWFAWNNDGVDSHGCSNSTGGVNVTTISVDKYKKVIDGDTALVKKVKKHYGTGGVLHDVKITTIRHILDYWDLGGTMFQDVMQDQEYQQEIGIATLQYQLNDVLTIPIYTEDEINQWSENMGEVATAINNYETFTYDPLTNDITIHTNDAEYKELLQQYITLQNEYATEISNKRTQVDQTVATLLNTCNSLKKTGDTYYDDYIDMLSMTMAYQLSGFGGFVQNEQNSIREVSERCSYIYGNPVFLARSLRLSFDSDFQLYSDDCGDEDKEIKLRSSKGDDGFVLYPNPTDNSITVNFKGNDERALEITNSVGKIMQFIKIQGSKTIDVSDYPDGVYFIIDRTGEKKTHRFIVIK